MFDLVSNLRRLIHSAASRGLKVSTDDQKMSFFWAFVACAFCGDELKRGMRGVGRVQQVGRTKSRDGRA